MPKRIQRKRSKGWRMPPNTVYVGRGTQWGNPFRPGEPNFMCPSKRMVVDKRHSACLYLGFAPQNAKLVEAARQLLPGKNLACYCKLCDMHADGLPLGERCPWCELCHADTLLEIANS